MLGRICMTLKPSEIISAVADVFNGDNVAYQKEENLGLKYKPSYNIVPGEIAPIIISAQHLYDEPQDFNYAIVPALWGLIPRWHKGNFRDHEFNTINFRVDNMPQSRMYKPAFNRGQRCAIVCEGYYEHQRVPYRLPPEERSIYYIHSQKKGSKIDDASTSLKCAPINLTFIAGVFDVWTDDDGFEIFNFTMLSMDSGDEKILSWLHPRTPAILESKHQIISWLNYSETSGDDALKLLNHPKLIEWYQVSDYVMDAKNKDIKCIQPFRNASDDENEGDDNED